MVTTRSAEKRSDMAGQEDLVLRSRTIPSPLSTKSTSMESRKRKVGKKESTDSQLKRSRLQSNDIGGEGDAGSALTGVTICISAHDDFPRSAENDNHMLRSKLAPPHETLDANIKDAGVRDVSAIEPMPQHGSGSVSNNDSMSRSVVSVSSPDSERVENETTFVHQSTDSSTHKEYETANEMIEESDEAPETIRIVKLPGKSSRRWSRRIENKNQTDVLHTIQMPGGPDEERSSMLIKKNIFQDQDAAVFSVSAEKPIQQSESANNKEDVLGPRPPKLLDSSEAQWSITRYAATADSSDPTNDTVEYSTGATLRALVSKQVPTAIPNASPDVLHAVGGPRIVQRVPTSTINSEPSLPILQDKVNRAGDGRTPQLTDALDPDINLQKHPGQFRVQSKHPNAGTTFPSNVKSKIRLPSPAHQSLSTFRKSRLEERATKAQNSFKFEGNWKSKRSAFVVS